jgi:hypothetical protein
MFQSTSKAEYENIAAKLGFNYLTFGSVNGQFQQALSTLQSINRLQIIINKNGGKATLQDVSTLYAGMLRVSG